MANKNLSTKELGNGIVLLHFEDAAQPVFLEKKGKPYILYGEKNDYPNYLLYLYNNSAKHNALINGKVDYIKGKGWTFDKNTTTSEQSVIADKLILQTNAKGESLDEVTEKITLDLELFNGAYLQIVWNALGEISSLYHIDYTTVRSNKDNSIFFVSDEWVKYLPDGSYKPNYNPKFNEYPSFNELDRQGTQILYIKKYHPGIDIYTLPSYRGSLAWIEVDIEIANYHLNNVKGGFFVNKIIQFNNGKPTIEEQARIEKMFSDKFGGVRGRKYMLAFNADSSKAASVLDLNIADSDRLFDQLNKTSQQEIFTGHRVTSPILFGIKTEGQLGGRNEMRDAYEIFQNTYINSKQLWIEKVIIMLSKFRNITTPLYLQRNEPIGFELDAPTIAANLTRQEIRNYIADKLSFKLSDDDTNTSVASFSESDDKNAILIFSQFGNQKSEYKILKSKPVNFSSDFDESLHFADVGFPISTLQQDIIGILKKDPFTTSEDISNVLNIDLPIIEEALNILTKKGIITVSENIQGDKKIIERKPTKEIIDDTNDTVIRSIQVMYSYEGPQDSRNRPFCAKMLELDRLYTRYEIERISVKLGYSVWARRGGWYTVSPGVHRPYCRHHWESHVVVKNSN